MRKTVAELRALLRAGEPEVDESVTITSSDVNLASNPTCESTDEPDDITGIATMYAKAVNAARIVYVNSDDIEAQRAAILERLGMTQAEADAQWDDCRCCLAKGNFAILSDLQELKRLEHLNS